MTKRGSTFGLGGSFREVWPPRVLDVEAMWTDKSVLKVWVCVRLCGINQSRRPGEADQEEQAENVGTGGVFQEAEEDWHGVSLALRKSKK